MAIDHAVKLLSRLPINSRKTITRMGDQERKLSDPWFEQWVQTDAYRASDGHVNRIPLRLASSNVVIYGGAKLSEVLDDFEHEDHCPVTVGGDVPVQLWCNNFLDTDCGPADRPNPYIETSRRTG